jgi:hypothetical protein
MSGQPAAPPFQAGGAVHAQTGAGDALPAALLTRGVGPVEEGQIAAGAGQPVGIEEMIGADVVLVDGALDQAHAQGVGVEAQILFGQGGDRGEVVQSGKL